VLDAINLNPGNTGGLLKARLSPLGNGIQLIDYSTGPGELTVTQNHMSHAAADLGLLASSDASTAQGELRYSVGLKNPAAVQSGVIITARNPSQEDLLDGVKGQLIEDPTHSGAEFDPATSTLTVYVKAGYTTAADVVSMINNSAAGDIFAAELDPTDADPVTHQNQGTGLVAPTAAPVSMTQVGELTGTDVDPREVEGIFTALLRMRTALNDNNANALQRSIDLLDLKTTDMNYTRAELGIRQQNVDAMKSRLNSDNLELQSILSQNYDVDMVQVATELSSRQTVYQAALMSMAKISQMSLLNYL
jgi:flagellar hook-associated protein 3 FlgL